jgi:3-methyladenine DNA glycosylase/8-oxoguanine DNA glycosylase
VPARTITLDAPLDLARILGIHVRGRGDPTLRIGAGTAIRASRMRSGPATVRIDLRGSRLEAEAWGPGADEALDRLPALIGLEDDRTGFRPDLHPLIADLDRRSPGLRIGRTGAILESLIPAVLEQKVTGREAWHGYQGLVGRWGERAPGPSGLRLAPLPEVLAAVPYHEFHPLGVERRRADLVRRIADHAERLEEIVALPLADAHARLRSVPGIGPWTAAEVAFRALGDPDAVSVGDFHLPNVVAWALAGEPRADDGRMLELLEPWRGQRARVVRLLELSGRRPPAYGPRHAIRSIASI